MQANRDQNFVTTLLGTSSVDGRTPITIWADPTTHRLLVDSNASGGSNTTVFMEIPVGVVNGINTIFTTTNLPLFVDFSGQVNVSNIQDASNYGYSITGSGPYTLTFVYPPSQNLHSFYNGASGGTGLSSFFQTDNFTSTAGQTVFTTSILPTFVLSFLVNSQPQTLTIDYTASNSTFTLNSGIPAGLPVSITYVHN